MHLQIGHYFHHARQKLMICLNQPILINWREHILSQIFEIILVHLLYLQEI